MSYPRILVVTSCTGEKRFKPGHQLKLEDFKDLERLRQREGELAEFSCAAGKLYTGMQHLRLMEGIQHLRSAFKSLQIDLAILSAGYGLVTEQQLIVPYEVTFNGMKGAEVDAWAAHLKVHKTFEEHIQDYDLVFMLLGDNYLRALNLPVKVQTHQTFVVLASQGSVRYIRDLSTQTFIWPLGNVEAKRYRYGLVGLKGFIFKKFSEITAANAELLTKVYENPQHFQVTVDSDTNLSIEQLVLPEILSDIPIATKVNKKPGAIEDDQVEEGDYFQIPDIPVAPNLHLGMQYFIPEWDDHVDPGYDFLNCTLTPGRDPYADEVYAHQIYPTPNYDGILVSKVVVDSSKKKRQRVEAVGIHKFIRFPGEVMGDCGAFGYIKEEVPPYNTDEILDYYQNLGFNYGVSIDHLIVGPFAQPGIREKRYELTLRNASNFIEHHRQRGHSFTPIGVAQGWSPESYAAAVKEIISMGYEYVALGGLARAPSKEIVDILKAVRPHLTANTRLHIFGVARLNAIAVFRHLGVTSFDSASPLRRAWLGAGANYHTMEKMYTAVRIPPVDGHGVRVKRLIEAQVSDRDTLKQLEQAALEALRKYDAGQLGIGPALETLLAYDELLELPREGKVDALDQAKRRAKHEKMYKELLEEQPWKGCDCVICQKIGVEVIIFRGNDRNRRRGFHNTYVFYKRFQALLAQLRSN